PARRRRAVRRVHREPRRGVARRRDHVPAAGRALVADTFRDAARREGARDAPSWAADADPAAPRSGAASHAPASGAHGPTGGSLAVSCSRSAVGSWSLAVCSSLLTANRKRPTITA